MRLGGEFFQGLFEGGAVESNDTFDFFAVGVGDDGEGDGGDAEVQSFGRADGVAFFVFDVLGVEPVQKSVAVDASGSSVNCDHITILAYARLTATVFSWRTSPR